VKCGFDETEQKLAGKQCLKHSCDQKKTPGGLKEKNKLRSSVTPIQLIK